MSKQGAASRWNGNRARYTEEDIDDSRWVKNAKGQWRLKEDSVPETQWLQRRSIEHGGFHKAARLGRRFLEITLDAALAAV